MFLQTVIEVICLSLLPKFIEDCNRLLPDGVADLARCMGLCALHVLLNNAVREVSTNDGRLTLQIESHGDIM